MARQDCDSLGTAERISVWGIRSRQWLGRHAAPFLRPGAWIVGATDAVYAVSQILKEYEVPSGSFWKHENAGGWLLVLSGAAGLVGTFVVFVGFDRLLRRADQDDELAEACRAIWQVTVQALNIDMDKVGVHVWSVKGLKGFRYLKRRATFVVRPRRRSSNVLWRRGKGALGIAWAEDDAIIANVAHLEARGRTRRLFCEIGRRDRFGLGWREFVRSRQYKAILAVPLRVRGKVAGCVSVDLLLDGYADDLDTLAKSDQLNNVLAVCEAVLAKRR